MEFATRDDGRGGVAVRADDLLRHRQHRANPPPVADDAPTAADGVRRWFDVGAFLARPLMAHLATGPADRPRKSPDWFLWEDGAIWLIGTSRDSFVRRLGTDGRCVIGVVDFALVRGVLQRVGMRGTAAVVALQRGRLHRLLSLYLGIDEERVKP